MATTFGFFTDANLTTPLAGNLSSTHNVDGSSPAAQHQIFFGSLGSAGGNTADRKAEADSNPGVDDLQASIVDADGSGTGLAATDVKLAATQGGLAGATPGAALSLGTTVTSGIANAKPIWIEVAGNPSNQIGTYTDLSVDTNAWIETDV